MRKIIIAATLAATVLPIVPAFAGPPPWAPAHGRRAKEAAIRYDDRGRYVTPMAIDRNDQIWRGSDGRLYCRRDNGTTGLIIGAAAGALLGRALDGGQHRTVGTLLGGAAGALLGREIDRGGLKCS
jgi:hypothetical protein